MKTFEKWNPIYLFYEQVLVKEKGEVGEQGGKHYKCYHGNWKTFTITSPLRYEETHLLSQELRNFSVL